MDFDLSPLLTSGGLIALLTLTVLEIVLGIDNIIFISILAGELPEGQQRRARTVGLSLAMITRVLLLLSLSWIMGLTRNLFSVRGHDVSGRDLVLILGGLFLIYKATREIHDKVEGDEEGPDHTRKRITFHAAIVQILLLDLVFSLDSVITAVGMVEHVLIMIIAVVVAVLIMLWASGPISHFVMRHPTVKVLALAFLVLIGVSLLVEGTGGHVNKGYIYFAMGFSVLVEALNLRMRRNIHRASDPDR
ncbi:MAG: TerC family protein [Flavobacteriales bacterium]|nr:TerC family protein [Flavobacteriales bacterium]